MNAPFQNEIGGSIDVVGVTNSRGVVGDRRIASGVRVLFLVDELEGITAGGSERQVLQLIDIMRKAGHEVWLAVFRNSNWLQQASGGFPTYFCGVNSVLSLKGFSCLLQFVRWMRAQRFDVVQTMFREANLLGPPLAKLAGVPIVLGSRRNLNHWMSWPFSFLQSISNRFSTRLVANSEAVRRVVSQRERTPLTRIDVIYNGVDTQYFVPDRNLGLSTRQRLGIPDDALLVGNVSRFGWIKGLDVFIRAAAIVLNKRPQTYFMVLGDGPLRAPIESLARKVNLQDKCIFLNAQRDIRPFLSASDIAVLTSRSEGFSNSLLEYMSAGLPIIATDVGGNPEALGDSGVLVPADKADALAVAILHLSEDAVRRQELGHRARCRAVELFDIAKAEIRIQEYVASLASCSTGRENSVLLHNQSASSAKNS